MKIEDLPGYLIRAGAVPRVHGNGFIQVDMTPESLNYSAPRYNFWHHTAIPRQIVNTNIHDHTYSSVSFILKGALAHSVFKSEPHRLDAYDLEKEVWTPELSLGSDHDTELVQAGENQFLSLKHPVRYFTTGDHYFLRAEEIHRLEPMQPSVTCMFKVEVGTRNPFLNSPPDKARVLSNRDNPRIISSIENLSTRTFFGG